jgi:hypothetical protein
MLIQRSARRSETENELHSQRTRLDQSGSGYELHLVLLLSANRAASVLDRDISSYRLRLAPAAHVLLLDLDQGYRSVFQRSLFPLSTHSANVGQKGIGSIARPPIGSLRGSLKRKSFC